LLVKNRRYIRDWTAASMGCYQQPGFVMGAYTGLNCSRYPERPVRDTILFIVLTFLITWGTGMLLVLSTHADLVNGARPAQHPIPISTPLAIILMVIGAYGPFLAAVTVTRLRAGNAGVVRLFSQFQRWRVHPIWFVTAFLGPAFLGLIALLITALSGGTTPAHWFTFPRPLRFAGWLTGPWGEELGWRGYMQPTLQKRLGALGASLVVGTVWSLWHYWPIATPAGGSLTELVQAPFLTWLAYEVATSVMMAWLYNSTARSLPIAWASHVGLSLGQNLVDKHPIPFGSFMLTFWAAAVLVIVVNGPRFLSRKRAAT
jgi:membrane protease YdiL (CAAX protease family)